MSTCQFTSLPPFPHQRIIFVMRCDACFAPACEFSPLQMCRGCAIMLCFKCLDTALPNTTCLECHEPFCQPCARAFLSPPNAKHRPSVCCACLVVKTQAGTSKNVARCLAPAAESDEENDFDPECEICKQKNNPERMLLCDGCNGGFHTYCLSTNLTLIPQGKWFCKGCCKTCR